MKLRKNQKAEALKKEIDLAKTVVIDHENYLFERKYMFHDLFSVMLPTGFFVMDDRTMVEKYPSVQRPDVVMTNADGTINFTFSPVEGSDDEKDIIRLRSSIKEAIRTVSPANLFFKEGMIDRGEINVAYFDFKSFSLDSQVYNMMYVFLSNEKVVIGNFNCEFELYDEWEPVLLEIMASIQGKTVAV